MALAGLTMASCTQEHIDVQYIPENAVAPVLGDIQGCELAEDGADIVVEYTKADFGVATAQSHNLYVSKSEDMADMKKAKATFDATTITLKQADLNVTALDFAAAGEEVDLYFAIVANLNTDKGAAVAGTDLQSNVVKATFKSYVADVLPTDKYNKVWVIGDYCGWDHGKTQFLFDYTASGTTFTGVVDFADKAANGFKLTGVAGWDDTCNWGLEDNTTAEAEATSLQLITGGGSQDIKCYAKRFYGFEFDNTSLVLKKTWSANQIGVIGLNGDWDNDIVMEYNPVWTRFYVDIEATGDTEMKFRADAGWDLNWGVDCAQGGDNIKVAAGKYRVYFNPATGLIEFSASKYGTEEDLTGGGNNGGGNEEPEGPVTEPDRWGVVGTLTSWGGAADLYMSEVGENLFVRMGVELTAEDQFKVRYNNGWDINAGAAGDVEPFAVTVGEELTLVGGGKNLSAPAGTYDIYFNAADYKMWVMNPGETPSGVEVKALKIYGDVSATGWTACYAWIWDAAANYTGGNWPGEALSKEGDYYVWNVPASLMGATVNVIFSNGEGDQTVDINGVVLSDDVLITLTDNEGGKWNATINGEAPVTPEPPAVKQYGLVGEFNGWGGSSDLLFEDYQDGYLCVTDVALEAGKGFKVRFYNDGTWNSEGDYALERGASTVIGEAMTLKHGGDSDNLSVSTTGTYDIYFNPTACIMYVMEQGEIPVFEQPSKQYGLVGEFNGWGGSSDLLFEDYQDGYLCVTDVALEAGKGFKVRFYNDGTWNSEGDYALERGASTVIGEAMTLKHGGDSDNLSVSTTGTYDIYFNPTACIMYVMVAGEVPAI